jgi:hypothetical protein
VRLRGSRRLQTRNPRPPRRRERENATSRTNVDDALSAQVELSNEACKDLALTGSTSDERPSDEPRAETPAARVRAVLYREGLMTKR